MYGKDGDKKKKRKPSKWQAGVERVFREGATGGLTGRATWASAMRIAKRELFFVVCLLCCFVLLSSVPTGASQSSNDNWAVTISQTKPRMSKSKLSYVPNPSGRLRMQSLLVQPLAGEAKSFFLRLTLMDDAAGSG